jgi:ribonuclease BN (tRNA processing enzyme)
VDLNVTPADVRFESIARTSASKQVDGVNVSWCELRHTQPCVAYRVETPDWTAVIATDHEAGQEATDSRFVEFCRGADFLLMDAFFTPDEYPHHRGWGHGTWQDAVELAERAQVPNLLLVHHHPRRNDAELDRIGAAAKRRFPGTSVAREDMVVAG